MTVGLTLGAPGIYRSTERAPFAFTPIRLDIAGFVGVALRGPVNTPVQLDSWTDYQREFGGFENPTGLALERFLPYAVQTFFAQGGMRAFVVRVAPAGPHDGPDDAADAATTQFRLGPFTLSAANEGAWGNRLDITLDFAIAARMPVTADEIGLQLPPGVKLPIGSLLRLRGNGLPPAGIMRWVEGIVPAASGPSHVVLDVEMPAGGSFDGVVITGTLTITDGDQTVNRAEVFRNLGLDPRHPEFLYSQLNRSKLIRPTGDWNQQISTDGLSTPVPAVRTGDGRDRVAQIDVDSFFDESVGADPLDEWERHRGVDAIGRQLDIGVLCVPDLDWQWSGPPPQPAPAGTNRRITSGEFESCTTTPEPDAATAEVPHSRLDPRNPADLEKLTRRQQRVLEVAMLRRRFVALLDVPRGIPMRAMLRWRARFDSSFAAAYHPWLGVPGEDTPHRTIVDVPPSAFAAGILAARENRYGIPWGPANELGAGAVVAADNVSDSMHDQLHLAGVNVFRLERDGFRLTAARTLSRDPDYRQLSVRRLITMLELTIDRQAQWLVFEPNNEALRRNLTFSITQLLRRLQRGGAFAGDTDADSFFVRCDDTLNPRTSQELGRLIAEVGVAPVSPLEYLVLRITQDQTGRVQVVPTGTGGR